MADQDEADNSSSTRITYAITVMEPDITVMEPDITVMELSITVTVLNITVTDQKSP
jgi:hypothetical protein